MNFLTGYKTGWQSHSDFDHLCFIMDGYSSGKEEYKRLIRPVVVVSRLISIWPLDDDHTKFDEIVRICHRIFMLVAPVIMSIAVTADALRQGHNMEETTECALIASAFYLSFIRIVNYTVHKEDLCYVVKSMRNDWANSTTGERQVLKDKCHMSYALAKQFIVTVFLALGLFMFGPCIEVSNK